MTSPAAAITGAVRAVTKDWARQRKAEERDRNAVCNRRMRLVRSDRTTLREAAFDVMEEAYSYASAGGPRGRLPVKPRQIMYAARPKILRMTGRESLDGQYFSQTLLIDYMETYDCSDWDIIWDARGHFAEPHTGREIPLGTLEVRQYLGQRPSFEPPAQPELSFTPFPTAGPENRYFKVLFIEKEGFHPILAAAHLQERLDVALMSTKGMSVTASRMLIDWLARHGVTVLRCTISTAPGFRFSARSAPIPGDTRSSTRQGSSISGCASPMLKRWACSGSPFRTIRASGRSAPPPSAGMAPQRKKSNFCAPGASN